MPGVRTRLSGVWSALAGRETKAATAGYFEQLLELLSMHRASKAGQNVTVTTALQVSTVLGCCRVIAEGIATMPWKLQRRFDDGRREMARELPLYRVLYRQPNEWMTSFEFREFLLYHALLSHGGYALISRDGNNNVIELLPMPSQRVRVLQDPDTTVRYEFIDGTGTIVKLPKRDVLHIRGPSWDGVRGMEAIHLAREAIGLAIAAEESQADLHKNGLQTSGIIGLEGTLNDKGRDRLKDRLRELATDESMGVLVLDQNAKFTKMALSGVDAQHIETRRFQIEEICRQLRVFPQMVGHGERTATYASAEQFFMAHVVHTLGPWADRIEHATDRDLIAELNGAGDFELIAKLSMQGLMRGDSASRAAFYASAITNGWMTRAEVRDFEDMPPIDGLDEPLMPLNMTTPDQAKALTEANLAAAKRPPAPNTTPGAVGGPRRTAAMITGELLRECPTLDATVLSDGVARVFASATEAEARDRVAAILAIVDP